MKYIVGSSSGGVISKLYNVNIKLETVSFHSVLKYTLYEKNGIYNYYKQKLKNPVKPI